MSYSHKLANLKNGWMFRPEYSMAEWIISLMARPEAYNGEEYHISLKKLQLNHY